MLKIPIICTFIIVLFSTTALGLCTLSLDDSSYQVGESATAIMSCSLGNEANRAYSLYWRDQSDSVLWIDNGTTPSSTNTPFFKTLDVPSGITLISANLTGTNLEGYDDASVSGTTNTTLLIQNVTFRDDIFIGQINSISYKVVDYVGNYANGGYCTHSGGDGLTEAPVIAQDMISYITSGYVHASQMLSFNAFQEDRDYLVHITCNYDSDGDGIIDKYGEGKFPFYIHKWLEVNTLVDRDYYVPEETIFICANVTNIGFDERVTMQITHQVRCSAYDDNDDDLDRAVLVSDNGDYDIRGIGANQTQNQCKRFILPEATYIQGKNNTCYASTQIKALNKEGVVAVTYDTTSPPFTIYSEGFQINPDWEKVNNGKSRAVINLSETKFSEYISNMTGNIDVRIDAQERTIDHTDQYTIYGINFQNFINMRHIESVISTTCNGDSINSSIEYLNDGNIEIELRGVNLNRSGCYIVEMQISEGDTMLGMMIGLIAIGLFFVGIGVINNKASRLGNLLRWSSMVIGYLQIIIISSLAYASSIGYSISPLLRADLWIIGLIGFGIFMLSLYLKTTELMDLSGQVDNKHDKEW